MKKRLQKIAMLAMTLVMVLSANVTAFSATNVTEFGTTLARDVYEVESSNYVGITPFNLLILTDRAIGTGYHVFSTGGPDAGRRLRIWHQNLSGRTMTVNLYHRRGPANAWTRISTFSVAATGTGGSHIYFPLFASELDSQLRITQTIGGAHIPGRVAVRQLH